MQATIFDIQRFSVHDGPGIRTTVFSKDAICTAFGVTIRNPYIRAERWNFCL